MKIEDLQEEILASKHESKKSLKAAEEAKVKVIDDIKSFRREMNTYLDNVEAELMQEVEKLNANDVSRQSQFECETMENEINEFQNKLDIYTDKINQLFVTAKLAQTKIEEYQKASQEIVAISRSQINVCKFEPCKEMESLKRNHSPLGIITTQTQGFARQRTKSIVDMKAHYAKKLNVKATGDIWNCWITGLAMISSNELLLADYNNDSLKILNVREDAVTSVHKTPGEPWDVTVIDSATVATTLVNKGTILFMNTTNGLSESHSLKVRKDCRGIDHRYGVIAVSFSSPPDVQILNLKGDILHEVKDTSIFRYPIYIAFNDDDSIVVSDWDKHAVYEITTDGQLNATMTSEDLKSPRGLVVTSNGTVVVCSVDNSDKVSMIVPDTRENVPLYVQHVKQPMCILLCEERNNMFVCENVTSVDHNFIKIYDLN